MNEDSLFLHYTRIILFFISQMKKIPVQERWEKEGTKLQRTLKLFVNFSNYILRNFGKSDQASR